MAEFKLGRIRFVWKSTWANGTVYYKDDVVRVGGRLYICVTGHTGSSNFDTDSANWNIFSDGVTWRGSWTPETYYGINDIVQYGGQLYIANTGHTSADTEALGLEDDSSSWDIFAEGFDWTGDWTPNTRYSLNQLVKYGGAVYLCVEGHTSNADVNVGLEANSAQWNVFVEGQTWKSDWVVNTKYKIYDIVKYGATSYICNTGHVSAATEASGLEVDQEKWDIYSRSFNYLSNWQTEFRYKVNDVVRFGGDLYICTAGHTSAAFQEDSVAGTLGQDEDKWEIFVPGLQFEDNWDAETVYQPGDLVTYGGYIYISKTVHVAAVPTVSTNDWEIFTTGFKFRGEWGEDSSNQDYRVGDVVRRGGYTYIATVDNQNTPPPDPAAWAILNTGILWQGEWTDETIYAAGDAVRYGTSSYICIEDHTSDEITEQNRPDQDISGTYWNLLASGPESSVLTTEGDLLYYGGAGPTRLPIGEVGEVLSVNSIGNPEWTRYGTINDVYYVALEGSDTPYPTNGGTLERPWRTIRYAAEQIEKGAKVPNARKLLESNRTFIQREVVEWINYQITNEIAPFTSGFTYDETKYFSDIGLIVDAIVNDITHSTNKETRETAVRYINNSAHTTGKEQETGAAIRYAIDVIEAVLGQTAPAVNYQQTNSFTPEVVQITAGEPAESGTDTTTAELVTTIALIVEAGALTGLPALINVNNSIFVKTGTYEEVLPIIVPEITAVVGDELRSTKIKPAGSIVDSGDTTYSLAGITRLKNIVDDLVTNSPIAKTTTGASPNNETQITTRPVGTSGDLTAGTTIAGLADEIIDILENGEGNADALVFTDTGVSDATTARTQLQTNRASIISDLISWITANYPNIDYNQTKCERDTGFIVDALSYDVQYGGNWASVIQARNYLNGSVPYYTAIDPDTKYLYQVDVNFTVIDRTSNTMTLRPDSELESDVLTRLLVGTDFQVTIDVDGVGGTTVVSGDLVSTEELLNGDVLLTLNNLNGNLDTGLGIEELLFSTSTNAPTIAAYGELKSIINNYVTGVTEQAIIGSRLDITIDVLTNGSSSLPAITYPSTSWATQALQDSNAVIVERATDIAKDGVQYVKVNFPTLQFNETTCQRDGEYIVNALAYDLAFGSNYQSVIAGRAYYKVSESAQLVIANQLDATVAAIEHIKETVRRLAINGAGLILEQLLDDIYADIDFNVNSNGALTKMLGSNRRSTTPGIVQAVEILEANRTFLIAEITAFIVSTYPAYTYDTAKCERDVSRYIDALKHDLRYPGNYASKMAARYYSNAVNGSLEEDMFYLRNATGLRNCTVDGLTGTLGSENQYGTKRPSAGAYGSLDPGWGPNDERCWILTRSPYVQNVTTFGTACIGMKVDGALHAGGNDSIVANDFTQILSDGIGYWVTNLGRAELVSVFTYYNHIGYLAETGGKIRATNGNNSYGDFGSVAEGVDPTEIPITATVNNRSLEARVGRILTNGNQILTLEYSNAGNNYTEASYNFTGPGFDATVDSANVVAGGVFEVRLRNPDDGSTEGDTFGGDGYVQSSNVAQEGNNTSIVLSATEGATQAQYEGMRVVITAGTGVGQYGIIDTYNPATKNATVIKESDGSAGWDHYVPGTSIEAVLNGTTQYSVEPRVFFAEPEAGGGYPDTAKARARVASNKVVEILIIDPGSGYERPPICTVVDPSATLEVPIETRVADGVLKQPTWTNRGSGWTSAGVTITGDGYADEFQPGTSLYVENLNLEPTEGSNIVFGSLPGKWYKIVTVRELVGTPDGIGGATAPYSANIQISPEIGIEEAVPHGDSITIRRRFSQVRLTGHDFLDIGTGNFANTNYPNLPLIDPDANDEIVEGGGGRVFYTSTDQDGNFRVGGLFNIEQATGVATLDVDAFNLAGLQELTLGNIALGSTGATITEFSTDGTFTANSDNIVPTQAAIISYIASQIGGGASSLNVNSLTAGVVEVKSQQINTTTGVSLNITSPMNFTNDVKGTPVALSYYLS